MNGIRKLIRRNKAPVIENKASTLTPEVTLRCGEVRVTGIACISKYKLVAVSTWKGVYVHRDGTQGEPIRVFHEHKAEVRGLVHLSDDILASVDDDGMLLTWRATTSVILDQKRLSKNSCSAIAKTSAAQILVGTSDGEIIIVEHENGKNLAMKRPYPSESKRRVYKISAYNEIFVASVGSIVEVRDVLNGQLLDTIGDGNYNISCVAVSDDLIAIGGKYGIIYVHQIREGFKLLRAIDLRKFHHDDSAIPGIWGISFLKADIVMATTEKEGIFFVSVESGECISNFQVENSNSLFGTNILSDGRVCVGGDYGYCAIFKPPQEIEDLINEFVQRKYSSWCAIVPFFSPPLKYILDGVLEKSVAISDAVDLVVHSKYHSESIEEWACAHLIVMAAVKAGVVPRSREFNEDVIFWWNHLYKKASLIEKGKEDGRLVLKFIVEAEEIGIIGGGCAEMFQATNEIRSEMNMLTTTIDNLYTRQIAMDEQVQGILHYQKVQQVMSFINAVLACIPLAGGVAVHVLSGGIAVLENADAEDFAVSGIVESLFGVGKDWSSFITEPIVKRFIRAGDVVLEEKTWNELPESNRRAVEAAADGLGMSIDDIRRRLQVAAQDEARATSANNVEEGEGSEMGKTMDGDEGTVIVNVSGESLQNFSTEPNFKQNKTEGRREEENEEGDFSKVIETMQLQMKQEKEKRETLEGQRKIDRQQIEEMKVKIEMMEQQIKPQGEKN